MANEKISGMTNAGVLAGTELFPLVKPGNTDNFNAPSGSFPIKLAGGAITSPVLYADFTMPTGFTSFQLVIPDYYIPDAGILVGAFSADGGTTFINPTDGYSSVFAGTAVGAAANSVANNNRAYLAADFSNLAGPNMLSITIYPGGTSVFPGLIAVSGTPNDTIADSSVYNVSSFVNGGATPTPVKQRYNLFRIMSENNTLNPPAGTSFLTRLVYSFWGMV